MSLHLSRSEMTKALRRIGGQQLLNESHRLIRNVFRPINIHAEDGIEGLGSIMPNKRCVTTHAFEGNDAKRPPVNSGLMTETEQDLWSHVLRSAHTAFVVLQKVLALPTLQCGFGLLCASISVGWLLVELATHLKYTELGQSKVCQLDMTTIVEQHIIGLEITMNDTHRVEVLDCQNDLGEIEASSRIVEPAHRTDQREEITTGTVLHHHEETL
mmetsp:Transcript_42636/g.107600  ORF Transcript_42636/g.107600 Transcript_42636/m.107600 type:complete len:214 (+) Transcript_42636:330-971(+)